MWREAIAKRENGSDPVSLLERLAELRRWYHRTAHGDPIFEQIVDAEGRSTHGLRWRCLCGLVIGESHYQPSEVLLQRQIVAHATPHKRKKQKRKKLYAVDFDQQRRSHGRS